MAALLAAGCSEPTPSDEVFLAIAREYPGYRLAARAARWAPELCTGPSFGLTAPPGALSARADAAPHGRKLYYLHPKDDRAYARGGEQPLGQVLVKEAWTPRAISAEEAARLKDEGERTWEALKRSDRPPGLEWKGLPVVREGKAYAPEAKAGLFIMAKLGTSGSDAGWVYATVSADGTRVTSSGAIASCVACHREAKGDRLFGLPAD